MPHLAKVNWPHLANLIWPEGWGPGVGGPELWGPGVVGARRGGGRRGGEEVEGGPKGWRPKGWGPKGWGPEGWGPKFRAFFLAPAGNFILSSLSGGSSRGILVVFESPVRSHVHVWSSLVVVSAARSGGAAGVSHDSPRAQMCTFQGSGLQKHHQNSTRRHPEREEK